MAQKAYVATVRTPAGPTCSKHRQRRDKPQGIAAGVTPAPTPAELRNRKTVGPQVSDSGLYRCGGVESDPCWGVCLDFMVLTAGPPGVTGDCVVQAAQTQKRKRVFPGTRGRKRRQAGRHTIYLEMDVWLSPRRARSIRRPEGPTRVFEARLIFSGRVDLSPKWSSCNPQVCH